MIRFVGTLRPEELPVMVGLNVIFLLADEDGVVGRAAWAEAVAERLAALQGGIPGPAAFLLRRGPEVFRRFLDKEVVPRLAQAGILWEGPADGAEELVLENGFWNNVKSDRNEVMAQLEAGAAVLAGMR
ncbi:MAG: hypothetical protein OEZ37_11685 [Gemmatimonadota bacterium]|nr:hypothetical protein [Gemmatimonadota bacterium]